MSESMAGVGDPPDLPNDLDAAAKVEVTKAQYAQVLTGWFEEWKEAVAREDLALAVQNARADTDRANEAALLAAVHAAYITTTQSSLDRAVTRINVVTAAVGTMITVYTALLGYVYSLDVSKGGRSLSIVAFAPTAFLGPLSSWWPSTPRSCASRGIRRSCYPPESADRWPRRA